jgi:hypothetical protein
MRYLYTLAGWVTRARPFPCHIVLHDISTIVLQYSLVARCKWVSAAFGRLVSAFALGATSGIAYFGDLSDASHYEQE